jgi:hypothetical protein
MMHLETHPMKSQCCSWIGSEHTSPSCSLQALEGKSYCEQHQWQVYQQGTAVKRRKDRVRYSNVRQIEELMEEAINELIEEGYDLT